VGGEAARGLGLGGRGRGVMIRGVGGFEEFTLSDIS